MENLNGAYNLVADKLETWIETFIRMLPNLVIALLVVIAFYVLGKIVRKAVKKLLSKVTDNQSIINLLGKIIGIMIIGIGFFIA